MSGPVVVAALIGLYLLMDQAPVKSTTPQTPVTVTPPPKQDNPAAYAAALLLVVQGLYETFKDD